MNVKLIKERVYSLSEKIELKKSQHNSLIAEINALEGARNECSHWLSQIGKKDKMPSDEELKEMLGVDEPNIVHLDNKLQEEVFVPEEAERPQG